MWNIPLIILFFIYAIQGAIMLGEEDGKKRAVGVLVSLMMAGLSYWAVAW